jgi:Arm DNA-binding domain
MESNKKTVTVPQRRTSTELTNLHCQKAAPKEKRYRLSDKGGLCLMGMPTGSKVWRYQYTFAGKMRELALGKYPDISLAQARVLHAQARVLRANGIDPANRHREEKQKQREKNAAKQDVAEQLVADSFDQLINYLLALRVSPEIIQAEIKKRGKNAQ